MHFPIHPLKKDVVNDIPMQLISRGIMMKISLFFCLFSLYTFAHPLIIECQNDHERIVLTLDSENSTRQYLEIYNQSGLGPNNLFSSHLSNSSANSLEVKSNSEIKIEATFEPGLTLTIHTEQPIPAQINNEEYNTCIIKQ